MKQYLLDTDICSYIIREHPLAVLQQLQKSVETGAEIGISVITYAELRLGAERSNNPYKHNHLITELCDRLDMIHAWDKAVADTFAVLQASLYKSGTPIGVNDTMIAAHAITLNMTLVSNNHRHYKNVPNLLLENWVN